MVYARMNSIRSRDKDGNIYEVPIGELVFRPSVYGIIISNGKILLSKQWDGYDFPGGGMEISETVHDAVVREVWEETGMHVAVGDVVTCESVFFSFVHQEVAPKFHANCILMYFLCDVIGGTLSTDNFDDDEKKYADLAEWVPLADIRMIRFYNSVESVKIIARAAEQLGLGDFS